jgi:hypothetical protein
MIHSKEFHSFKRMNTCGDLIDSAHIDGMFFNKKNRRRNMDHLQTAILAKKDETATGQVTRQGNAPHKDKMFPLFVDSSGTVHMEFIPEGATVNKHRYKAILHCLCNSILRKRPEFWGRKYWLYLHNSAPTHRAVLVQEELPEQQVTVWLHHPHSPDLEPCDFLFFSSFLYVYAGTRMCNR